MGKKEDDKRYYLKNKEKISNYRKRYYLIHKEREMKLIKSYHQNHVETIKDYIKKYHIERRKTDPNFNLRHRLRSRLNFVFKKYGNGKVFPSSKYGINYKAIIEHLKPFPKEISNYEIDHIRPLSSFDLTNLEEIKIAFAPENHQWLTESENVRKGNKWQD